MLKQSLTQSDNFLLSINLTTNLACWPFWYLFQGEHSSRTETSDRSMRCEFHACFLTTSAFTLSSFHHVHTQPYRTTFRLTESRNFSQHRNFNAPLFCFWHNLFFWSDLFSVIDSLHVAFDICIRVKIYTVVVSELKCILYLKFIPQLKFKLKLKFACHINLKNLTFYTK